MSLRRFLVPPGALEAGRELELPPQEAAHARKVLRLRPGQEVWLLDGRGRMARAELLEAGRRRVAARVLEIEAPSPARPRLVLCPGLLKPPAMDLLAQKLTELQVDELRPFLAARSVAKAAGARLERWRRLAVQALKQCGAARPPRFAPPAPLEEVLAAAPPTALKLVLYEKEPARTLAGLLAAAPRPEEVWALIGPEGGLEPAEVAQAREAGFAICGLPGAVLRAETASLALAAVVRFSRDWNQT